VRWLRRGIRERLIRALVPQRHSPDERFDILLHGYRFSGHVGNWIDRNIYLYGGYEQEVQSLIRHLSVRGGIGAFVDIGANVGLHTLLASTLYSQVHAFEPYPPAHERLAALLVGAVALLFSGRRRGPTELTAARALDEALGEREVVASGWAFLVMAMRAF